jgi:hypothetical protein
MNNDYYVEQDFNLDAQLIQPSIKTQVLNGIKQRITDQYLSTENKDILAVLDAQTQIIEDAYKIDMYKFQFKLLINILNKELDNIKTILLYEM